MQFKKIYLYLYIVAGTPLIQAHFVGTFFSKSDKSHCFCL